MKKKSIIAILLILVMCFTLVGCGGDDGKVSTDSLEVGTQIEFGYYEQDGNTDNGQESVTWVVCGTMSDDYVVLMSRYALDYKQYHSKQEQVTWETCSLRKWLNDDFYNQAFTDEEKTLISEVSLKNPDTKYAKGGNDTNDKVWIFNKKQAKKYTDILAVDDGWVASTYYAQSKGAQSGDGYWLRIPKKFPYGDDVCAAVTFTATSFPPEEVDEKNLVRPVIALPLSSDVKVIATETSYFSDGTLTYSPADDDTQSPEIGMTAEEVRKSAWGSPDKINKDETDKFIYEQWVYEDRGYVYLKDGIVTSIQHR